MPSLITTSTAHPSKNLAHTSNSSASMMLLCRLAVLLAAAAICGTDAFTASRKRTNNIRTCHYSTRNKRSWSEYAITEEEIDSPSRVEFISPLLQDGYPQAVQEYERISSDPKPVLLYLPGFDGTTLAPFLQFPALGEEFDVKAMQVAMDDRSTFEDLKDAVINFLVQECIYGRMGERYELCLMGESFGGILAIEVAAALKSNTQYSNFVRLQGLILVNPATSYLRSELYRLGPPIANSRWLRPIEIIPYIFGLTTKLVPLFLDEGLAMQQLFTILSSKGLPAVVNTPQREAYMGRVAMSLANRLKFMPKDTLKWRLEEWLQWGNAVFEDRLEMLKSGIIEGEDDRGMLRLSREVKTLIVVGEFDKTLPSLDEADRLAAEVFRNNVVHVVTGAGHASTCGGTLNLMQLLRQVYPELNGYRRTNYDVGTTEWKPRGGDLNGLVPRYDYAKIGLSPLLYWSSDYYREWKEDENPRDRFKVRGYLEGKNGVFGWLGEFFLAWQKLLRG
jgi:pimeloyl-ACP methyl ester carboxylesterase